ncbi:hypothetical protein NL676_009075 [Syzygium grande]|nr:hypothetical protein NL676_009075 [Syzygium grande]
MHRTCSWKPRSDLLEDFKVFKLRFLARPDEHFSTPATDPSDGSASHDQEPSIFIFTRPFPGSDPEHVVETFSQPRAKAYVVHTRGRQGESC